MGGWEGSRYFFGWVVVICGNVFVWVVASWKNVFVWVVVFRLRKIWVYGKN